MDTRLMQQIKTILKDFPHYWHGEELQRNVVIEDLKSYDALLISALLKNQKIKEHYTVKAGETTIFKVQEFIDILRYKDYWADSYTKYANTVGLASEGKYLQYNSDVVLEFPYKDCVLEGGMTKEDKGKEEVFYNNIIARDEIDTLLAPKTLVNVKKYDKDGEHEVTEFSDEDNIIIKGNNLLALHSLKERYVGKVKFIYLDPPYYFEQTRPSDTFSYNSNFKLSSWLVFMKNRLEIARDLLDSDGVIFISISEDSQAYLRILMDEVFGKNNFVETFIWRNTDNADSLGNKSRSGLEYLHSYEKVKNPNRKWIGKDTENGDAPLLNSSNGIGELRFKKGIIRFNIPDGRYQAGIYPKVELLDDLFIEDGKNVNSVRMKGKFKWSQTYLDEEVKRGGYFIIKSKQFSIRYQKSDGNAMAPEKMIDISYLSKIFGVGSYEDSNSHLEAMGINFTYSKPESLITFLMRATTDEEDLVLDFFMGSGTTQSSALKMNRRFIGIDQMDYINTVSVPRLQKVIEGEQGGISKDVDWQGGGSFVYAELMELNQVYMAKIDQASSKEELASLWAELDTNADLNFQLDKEKLTNDLLKDRDEEAGSVSFDDLTLAEQKAIFKGALDQNQLYVPYSEIDDETIKISGQDKAFNRSFYNDKGVE